MFEESKPDYESLVKLVQNYSISEQAIRYAHKICPDDQLMVADNLVDRNEIGLIMPSSPELMGEAGFDITDKFMDNLENMFKRKSMDIGSRLLGAQLKKYWSLCLKELGEYKYNLISGNLLLNRGIDYAWKDDPNTDYSVQDIKTCLERNILLLGDVMNLYSEYLFAKEGEPHLWAHYKINFSKKIEEALCDFYKRNLETTSEDEEGVIYGLKVALITHRPGKGSFINYSRGIVKKILYILETNKKEYSRHPDLSLVEIVGGWVREHKFPKELANKMLAKAENLHEQPYKEPHSASFDLCKTLYKFEKQPIIGCGINKSRLKKIVSDLEGGDRYFVITYYFESLNWREMQHVFDLPKDLLKEIQKAVVKKIRIKSADLS